MLDVGMTKRQSTSRPHRKHTPPAGVPIYVDPAGRVMLVEICCAGVRIIAGKGLEASMRDDGGSAERSTNHGAM
jgi:hypothetical protein